MPSPVSTQPPVQTQPAICLLVAENLVPSLNNRVPLTTPIGDAENRPRPSLSLWALSMWALSMWESDCLTALGCGSRRVLPKRCPKQPIAIIKKQTASNQHYLDYQIRKVSKPPLVSGLVFSVATGVTSAWQVPQKTGRRMVGG